MLVHVCFNWLFPTLYTTVYGQKSCHFWIKFLVNPFSVPYEHSTHDLIFFPAKNVALALKASQGFIQFIIIPHNVLFLSRLIQKKLFFF
jgi:hypothetical protein